MALPSGAELILIPEPENPYDAGAIKVLVNFWQVPESQLDNLEQSLVGTGFTLGDLDLEPIHLGYIISATNKKLGGWSPNTRVAELMAQGAIQASLGFSPTGEPVVITRPLLAEGDQ
jgi:hypothetical protein